MMLEPLGETSMTFRHCSLLILDSGILRTLARICRPK